MFRGINPITMDAKGRFAMPSKYREILANASNGVMVANIHLRDKCLVIYPTPVWEDIEQQLQELSTVNPETGPLRRLMLAYATDTEMDSNGRILLPASLREHACLGKKVVLVGQGRGLELWSEELWNEEKSSGLIKAQEVVMPEEIFSIRF